MLQEVRGVKALVVLLVDLLDASGTLMSKVRGRGGRWQRWCVSYQKHCRCDSSGAA
jgi:hypothetical protein